MPDPTTPRQVGEALRQALAYDNPRFLSLRVSKHALSELLREFDAMQERLRALEAAEEGAKEAFGVVAQAKHDALAECERLRKLLDGAHSQIRRMARESEAASCGVNR